MRKDLNILVCGALKKDEVMQIYSRSSECTKVYHCCHSVSSSPSVLLQPLVVIQPRLQRHVVNWICTDSFSQNEWLNKWNSLHQSIIDSTSINCFKNGLKVCVLYGYAFLWISWSAWPYGLTYSTDPSSEQVRLQLVSYNNDIDKVNGRRYDITR